MAKKLLKLTPKEQYTKIFLEAAEWDSSTESIEKYKPVFWYSYRDKEIGGLRLSDQGMEFLKTHADLKTYNVDFPSDFSWTPQTMLWLDQHLNSPYYITKKTITVIAEKAAFELYLFNGDVRKFGLSKSLAKRLAQD
jgi:hypothetical protein